MTHLPIEIRRATELEAPRACETVLRSVPEWFGIESSTEAYINASARLPTWIARLGETAVGFVTVERHAPKSAEIHCMAVAKNAHGMGVGTALTRWVERVLWYDGIEYLQVKTQGPSRPSPEYARTLHFYERMGFVRLEEVHELWAGIPCLILVKRLENPGTAWLDSGRA